MKMCRIEWRDLRTGEHHRCASHPAHFCQAVLEQNVAWLNKRYQGKIVYWVQLL